MLYFILSRYLLDPFAWCLYLLIGALVLHHYKRVKVAITVVACTAVFMAALMTMPLDQLIIRPLENRHPRPAALPAHIDGIVVLSGGLERRIFGARRILASNVTTERLLAAVALARRHPEAKLVFSGVGRGSSRVQDVERAAFWQLIDLLGMERAHVVFEDRSTTTVENLVRCRQLLHPKSGETWILVTSAIHMPRAMATAQQVGWRMTPWPSDYMSTPRGDASIALGLPSGNVVPINQALHEWVGLLVYRLRGWTD